MEQLAEPARLWEVESQLLHESAAPVLNISTGQESHPVLSAVALRPAAAMAQYAEPAKEYDPAALQDVHESVPPIE